MLGWYFGAYEKRLQQRKEVAALSGALLMEATEAAWHILNTCEILKRVSEEGTIPTVAGIDEYLPTPPRIYPSAAHLIAQLGATAAQNLVEYHSRLERTMARTRVVCSIDGRRTRKAVRLNLLKDNTSDWRYVAWACSESMKELLRTCSTNLTPKQLDFVTWYAAQLAAARSDDFDWPLPEDTVRLIAKQEADPLG